MIDVWTYWAGPMPDWISTCLRSMIRCCKRTQINVLTPDNLPSWIELPRRWLDLPPGVGTDCLRSALLAQRGGFWIDADTIMIRDPIEVLMHGRDRFLYSKWPASPDRVIAGYVYSPKGHSCAVRWHDACVSALKHASVIGWGDLGERTLTPIINMQHDNGSTWQIPIETFLPIDIDTNVERYFKTSGWCDFATNDTVGFGLNFSWMQQNRPLVMNGETGKGLMIRRLIDDTEQAR